MAGLQGSTDVPQRRHFSVSTVTGGTGQQTRVQESGRTISIISSPSTISSGNPNDSGKLSGWHRGSYYQIGDMWTAALNKDSAALQKCLKAGLNVNSCRWHRSEGSHPPGARCIADIAAYKNDVKSMRLLLGYAVDLCGNSVAAFAFHTRAQRDFAIPPNDRDAVERHPWTTPLHRACRYGFEEMTRVLLEEGHVDPNVRDSAQRTGLHLAVIGKHVQIAKMLLDRGASVDSSDDEGMTPLIAAALSAHKELVELFLDHGAFVNATNQHSETPLYCASQTHHTNIMARLVSRGADIDARSSEGMSAFFKAASSLRVETMSALAEYGANVDSRDSNGCTALIRATMAKNIVLIRHLLHLGADIDIEDGERWTPLFVAMVHNDESVIRLLLVGGCDISKTDVCGNSGLHQASILGSTSVARHVLTTRSHPPYDPSTVNIFGQTPLMLAAKHGHSAIVKILLKHGANLHFVDLNGYRALDGALYWGNHACVRLLLEAGAPFDNHAFLALQQGRYDNPNAGLYDMILGQLRLQYNISWNHNMNSQSQLRDFLARDIELKNIAARMREKQGKPSIDSSTGKPSKDTGPESEDESPDPFEACIPKLPPSLIINNNTTNIKAGGNNALEAAAVSTNVALGIAGLVLGA